MDQQKTGTFLKELRKDRNLTQEQLAEKLNVSGRTVSRWETGNNMPDLSILVEIADFYDVDIREIINGERKSETMDNELKDTLTQVAEYSAEEKKKIKKRMIDISIGAAILLLLAMILNETNLTDFAIGLAFAILVLNALYFAGFLDKAQKVKENLLKRKG